MMTAPAAVAAASDHGLLDDDIVFSVVVEDEQGEEGRPGEKDDLHDPEGKRSFEHGTGLVDVGDRVALEREGTEGTQRYRDRPSIPVVAVRTGDEAKLIDCCNEGSEEAEIDEGDKDRRALGAAEPEQGVEAPEHREGADNKEDQDIRRCQLVIVEEAIDKICLYEDMLVLQRGKNGCRRRCQHLPASQ